VSRHAGYAATASLPTLSQDCVVKAAPEGVQAETAEVVRVDDRLPGSGFGQRPLDQFYAVRSGR
jgi:hypothetical protein